MLSQDGNYVIYAIQSRKNTARGNPTNWGYSNLDYFRSPTQHEFSKEGLSACGDCWQRTGIHGTFSKKVIEEHLVHFSTLYPDREWRYVCVKITQTTIPVKTIKTYAQE